jgi:hypothetical protein
MSEELRLAWGSRTARGRGKHWCPRFAPVFGANLGWPAHTLAARAASSRLFINAM